ncbi:bifunctional serine/threonine-protein kinase/formylglycine-generating enzyme family protein [Aquisphaera insulae]|uniref:bifunctional serine/threonine-protein kinase/formylglycine-generating enzyme family protein n=1 Tax=Aquisphaera insulae TaxID=2712864 RepID=UPI0013EE38FF|nr:bifunctional serine/threonine-protein kinase/formylglycine-generating enzyme family protein [Aquisphaera insulae]
MRPTDEDSGEQSDNTWQGLPEGVAVTPESDLNNQTLPAAIGLSTPPPDSEYSGSADSDPSGEDSASADVSDSGDEGKTLKRPSADRSDEWDLLPPPKIAKGQMIFGKYRLVEKLGEGGMGDVWLVDNVELGRKCALKLLKPQIAHNDKGWRRFRREARLMAKLEHPNAIVVHDFKRSQSIGYIEMEYVRGRSLDKLIDEHKEKPFPLEQIASILDQLCAVLHQAHGHLDEETGKPKPIIHRDLKPSNIMVQDGKPPGQNIKVLDFGIAKMVEDDSNQEATLTNVGDVLGTPAFMSPEQVRGGWGKHGEKELDSRSDLYSVGVILYQLLTAKIPFTSRDPRGMMAAHLTETPRTMKQANPGRDVPPAIERLVMQCLEKDPSRRPSSAQEVARRFREAIGGAPARPAWIVPAAACATVLLLVGGLGFAFWPSPGRSGRDEVDSPPVAEPPTPPTPPPVKPAPRSSLPAGYRNLPGKAAPEDGGEPARIERVEGGIVFERIGEGLYLPEGYEPDKVVDNVGRWPRVVIRKSDGVRFIRIHGLTYRRGDLKTPPDTDGLGNPIKPHWVRVKSFYIQEKEVTNAEIEAYVMEHPDQRELFADWRDLYTTDGQTRIKPAADAARLPAAKIAYHAAARFARTMNGLLPTEAQWELAAKSGQDENIYPWGKEGARRVGNRSRANVGILSGTAFVGSFEKDVTADHIFDMAGNVRELCRDGYRPYSEFIVSENTKENPLDEPCSPLSSDGEGGAVSVAVRGSSFQQSATMSRTFFRDRFKADESSPEVGFRLVLECPPDPTSGD